MNIQSNFLVNNNKIKKLYRTLLKPVCDEFSLTQNEVDILLFLYNNREYTTAKHIVEIRGIVKSHVCKSVQSLTANGYLVQQIDTNDKRCIHLFTTEKTQIIAKKATVLQKKLVEILLKDIPAEKLEVLEEVFEQMFDNIERYTHK